MLFTGRTTETVQEVAPCAAVQAHAMQACATTVAAPAALASSETGPDLPPTDYTECSLKELLLGGDVMLAHIAVGVR